VFSLATIALAQQPSGSASFLTSDTSTRGNWEGVYGADGAVLTGVTPQNIPSYATFQVQNQENYAWDPNPSDPRALETGSGTARIAACWYSPATFNFDVNFTDGNTHQFALYAVDWDHLGRAETIQILDVNTGNQLDLRTLSNFSSGAYLVWNISGHVRINVTNTGGTNAVVSGVFFGPVSKAAVATFLISDTSTGGGWEGVYGTDGTALANVTPQNIPSYVRFYVQNQENYTWDSNPSDPRALETGSGTARIAACWYNPATFNFDVNFTDGNTHQFALYAVDWDHIGRAETIQIVDIDTGNQLDLRTLSNFSSGAYLVWNISGHVRINVTNTGGANAVVSGVFFGAAAPVSVTTTSLAIGQQGMAYSATLTASGGMAPYSWSISSGALPSGLTLNNAAANIGGTPTQSGTFPFALQVKDSSATPQTASETMGMTIAVAVTPVQITTSSLGSGQVNSAYAANLIATGGTTPYLWSINSGALPTGLVLNPSTGQISGIGMLSGTPAASGTSSFTVQVTDSTAPMAQTATESLSITLAVGPSVLLTWAASSSSATWGYNVYRSNISGGGYSKIDFTPVSGLIYTDTTVVSGQTYYYVVTAVDLIGDESAFSNEIQEAIP
jgi:hypothetical protein